MPGELFPMTSLQKISVLGGGLLGGSLALSSAIGPQVTVWSRRSETTATARDRGMNATSDLAAAVQQADLLILCVPVGSMADLLEMAIAAGLPQHCLITDVGSVKRLPHEALRPLLRETGRHFIGSHPMAGGEKGGIEHARADLYRGAACLLTNDESAPATLCQALEHFWQTLGCRTAWATAAEHDAIVARVSHLPHALACIGAKVSLQDPTWGAYCGNGLRDTTRVAAGNPTMWAEILLENRDQVLAALQASHQEIQVLTQLLESAKRPELEHWLQQAKHLREGLTVERGW
jgi:prephenate dehydrogenase